MSKIKPPAPYAYDGLDRIIHEKARLGVMTSLVGHPKGLAFGDLRQLCGLTDGNLSRHLQVLQEAGLVELKKTFEKNRPLTTCRITAKGRKQFLAYLEVLEKVVRDAADAADEPSKVQDFLKPQTG
ncbi:MAG: transcriptional regulator [Pseudomonadota bacterium]